MARAILNVRIQSEYLKERIFHDFSYKVRLEIAITRVIISKDTSYSSKTAANSKILNFRELQSFLKSLAYLNGIFLRYFQAVLPDPDPAGDPASIRLRSNVDQHRGEDAKLEEDSALERDGHPDRWHAGHRTRAPVRPSVSPFPEKGRQQAADTATEEETL